MTLHGLIQRLNQIGRQQPEALKLPAHVALNLAPRGVLRGEVKGAWLVSDALIIEAKQTE